MCLEPKRVIYWDEAIIRGIIGMLGIASIFEVFRNLPNHYLLLENLGIRGYCPAFIYRQCYQ